MEIIIIGSGMAGLTAGAYLARSGYEVTILEQYHHIGGVTQTPNQDGYSWDIGPLIVEGLGPEGKIRAMLEDLGIMDQINIVHEDRGLVTKNFDLWHPEKYEGPMWRRDKLKQIFPHETKGLDKYYRYYYRVLKLLTLGERLEKQTGLKKLLTQMKMLVPLLYVKRMFTWNTKQYLGYFFTDPWLKAVYSGLLADLVVKPSEFLGIAMVPLNVESAFDKRTPIDPTPDIHLTQYNYIIGGCEKLVDILANYINTHGGTIRTGACVSKILIKDQAAEGVQLENGDILKADYVISTVAGRETILDLIGKDYLSEERVQHAKTVPHMESVHMVHLGIDFDPTPYQPAALCYYYRTPDIEGAVDKIRAGVYHEGEDGFLIYIPSLHSPSMAPPGKHAVTIYTVAPNFLNESSWAEKREEFADKLVEYAEENIPGLKEHTQTRLILDPDDFRKLIHVKHHSFGGLAPTMDHTKFSYDIGISNFFLAGAQSESSGGMRNAMEGGMVVAKRILSRNE